MTRYADYFDPEDHSDKHIVDITMILSAETDKAILCKETEDSEGVWFPKSLVQIDKTMKRNIVVVSMPEWLAEKENLI